LAEQKMTPIRGTMSKQAADLGHEQQCDEQDPDFDIQRKREKRRPQPTDVASGPRVVEASSQLSRSPGRWIDDPAFASTALGRRFTEWFEIHNLANGWIELLEGVPVSRLYEVADEARRRANIWTEIARTAEQRVASPQLLRA
jgi:hypothetical protein